MSWNTKNLLTRLFRRPTTVRRDQTNRFRPALLPLEDRTVPAGADLFANATILTGTLATDTGNTDAATGEPGEPGILSDPSIHSIWWQWEAPESGVVEVNTFGSDFDTLLGVYTGSLGSLDAIAENDDDASSQSRVLFDAVAGTTYFIAVDGYSDQFFDHTGNVSLHLGMTPDNDDFGSATVVSGGTVTGHNLASTGETGEPTHDGEPGPTNSVWWQWTATESGLTEVNTLGSDFDTVLAVYTGSSVDGLTFIASNDDAGGGVRQSLVNFTAVAGQTYYIAVDGFLNETGSITLTVPDAPTTENNPPVIDPQTFSVAENSTGGAVVGTVEASDPDGQTLNYSITGGNEAGRFSINAETGEIRVLTNGLNYEAQSSYELTVRVTDSGNLSSSAAITIELIDVNENPTLTLDSTATIAENSAAGTFIATASGFDVDAGDILTYSIVSGNTGGAFAIDASGNITVANPAALDFETNPTFHLVIRVTDNGGLMDEETITVSLSDLDETPTPALLIGQISNSISDLAADGSLTTSQAADLQAKLNDIAKKIEQGNTTPAVNNIKAFINKVNSLVGTSLSQAEADSLINAACALKTAILA